MKIAFLTTDNRENFREYSKVHPEFGTAPQALLDGFAQLPNVEVHVISCTQKPVRAPEKLADNIYFHSLLVSKIGWMRSGYQGCIRAVRRKLQEIRPDLVHGQGTERDCALTAIFSGYPNVITIHGNMRLIAELNRAAPLSFEWLAARIESFTIPRTSGVICISSYTQKAVTSLARKTWLVPNAVDASFFSIIRDPASPIKILSIGNITQRKNQNALIRALDRLPDPKTFELIFLGAVSQQESYGQEFFSLLKDRPWCRYEGFADRKGVHSRLAIASGLIHPSLEDNCPMVILEAMAAGVPIAASKVGGIPDLIRDEETGFLFNPQQEASMVAGMNRLLELRRAQEIGLCAQAEAFRFYPRQIAEEHLKIYSNILAIG